MHGGDGATFFCEKGLESGALRFRFRAVSSPSLYIKPEESFWRAPGGALRFFVLAATLSGLGFVLFAAKPWDVAGEAALLEAAGKKSDLAHDIARGLWFGFVGSSACGLLLIFSWKLWGAPLDAPKPQTIPAAERLAPPLFWILVMAAVALGGYTRWNLAKRSLWWDEIWAVKHASLGYLKEKNDAPGEFRFLQRDWRQALWTYQKPTNHPLVSVASKASQTVWRRATGAADHEFSPLAVRAPTLAAGLAAILCIALLVRRWGFGLGGVAAAFLLALHPWHIRYGMEARAYSFAVLWTILGCLWLTYAISDSRGRWRYWLLFGLNQLLLTWSLPNGFWYAGGFAVAGFVVICYQWRAGAARTRAWVRLLVVNIMAAMAFLPLFMPNLLQALRWGAINDHALLTPGRLTDALCQMAFGMGIAGGGGGASARLPSLSAEFATSPWATWLTLALLSLTVVVGAIRLGRARPGGAVVLGGIVAAATLSLLLTWLLGQFFYHRYIIYILVPFAVCFGIGLTGLTGLANGVGARRALAVAAGLAVMGLYLYTTRAQRSLLAQRPYAPFADVAGHLRMRAEESGPSHVIGYGLGGRMFQVYFPEAKFAKNGEDLAAEIRTADERGLPPLVVLGYRELNRNDPTYSSGFEILDRPGAFHEARGFPGIDPLFYFRVLERAED